MKTLKTSLNVFATLLTLLALNANAENQLSLGEGVNVIAVNGSEVSSDSLFSNKTSFTLPNGTNQLLVNYTAEVKKGSELELEASDSFVLLFESNNQALTLSAPKITKMSQLEAFESNKNWTLASKSGEKISYKVSLIKHKGFQLSRDYERELENFNNSDNSAALPSNNLFTQNQVNKIKKHTKKSAGNITENVPAQMLMYWYTQADEKTRKSFKEFISNL